MKNQSDFWQAAAEMPFHGRRKRREKVLDAGDLRLLMLHLLSGNPAHGYQLIKAIEDLSKGEYAPSPGIIYPNLSWLEESDCIAVVDARATRKVYRLEQKGQLLLQQNQPALAVIIQRLSTLAVLVNNRSRPDVERAIHNMKTALHLRLAQEEIQLQTLNAIIDALDEAAKKITRC